MKKIELTRGLRALVDDDDYEELSKYKWCASPLRYNTSYALRNVYIPGKSPKTIFMHNVILNPKKGELVDHIDGDGLDNRKTNLRICTNTQNQWNKPMQSNNKTGYKGVSYYKTSKKWKAKVVANGVVYHLGTFDSPELAGRAYDKGAQEYHGEFARLNFPEDLLNMKKDISGNKK